MEEKLLTQKNKLTHDEEIIQRPFIMFEVQLFHHGLNGDAKDDIKVEKRLKENTEMMNRNQVDRLLRIRNF